MLRSAELIAFVLCTNAEATREFYRDRLGLELQAEELPQALVFDAGGTMLRASLVPHFQPLPATVIGWGVEDMGRAVSALTARGIEFIRYPGFDQDESSVWQAPDGTKVAWFSDPDGNILSLTQFPSD